MNCFLPLSSAQFTLFVTFYASLTNRYRYLPSLYVQLSRTQGLTIGITNSVKTWSTESPQSAEPVEVYLHADSSQNTNVMTLVSTAHELCQESN